MSVSRTACSWTGETYITWRDLADYRHLSLSCVHEAAHAVVGHLRGRRPQLMALLWTYRAGLGYVIDGGIVTHAGPQDAVAALAGHAAIKGVLGLGDVEAQQNFTVDVQQARAWIAEHGGTLERANDEAIAILRQHWHAVKLVARALREHGSLQDVDALVARAVLREAETFAEDAIRALGL